MKNPLIGYIQKLSPLRKGKQVSLCEFELQMEKERKQVQSKICLQRNLNSDSQMHVLRTYFLHGRTNI
jgi:hypothetical protein